MITVLEQMQNLAAGNSEPYINLQEIRQELIDYAEDESDDSSLDMDFNVEVRQK